MAPKGSGKLDYRIVMLIPVECIISCNDMNQAQDTIAWLKSQYTPVEEGDIVHTPRILSVQELTDEE